MILYPMSHESFFLRFKAVNTLIEMLTCYLAEIILTLQNKLDYILYPMFHESVFFG